MSRSIFKGALGSGDQEAGARYKPGQGEHDSGLAGDLVRLYSSGELWKMCPFETKKKDFRNLVGFLGQRIASQADLKELEANHFLEDIISCTYQGIGLPDLHHAVRLLIDPIMQALYNKGHNGFSLDLSMALGASMLDSLDVGGHLEGKKNRQLRLAYKGDAADIGYCVEHVRLEHRGKASWVGSHARSSEFILHDRASHLGQGGSGCTYHLLYDEPDKDILLQQNTLLWGENNSFYFHKGLGSDVQEKIRLQYNALYWLGERDVLARSWGIFFNRGNRIFIPKGEDEWEEIAPHES